VTPSLEGFVHQHPQLRKDLADELRRGLDERAALMAQKPTTVSRHPLRRAAIALGALLGKVRVGFGRRRAADTAEP
jgi:hypothetical protein